MREGTPLSPILFGKIIGGGKGGAENAVLYVLQTLTDAQKTQARSNIGAVSADEIGNVFTVKGSVATVADLPATGNSIGDVYYVEAVSAGYIWITSTTYPDGYWEELGEPIDLSAYVMKPTVQAISTSAASIEPVDNTVYDCTVAAITSLTITNPPATGSYVIKFNSGSTPTTTTIPGTIHGLESFAAEANTHYEINVEDNYAVVGKWAIS